MARAASVTRPNSRNGKRQSTSQVTFSGASKVKVKWRASCPYALASLPSSRLVENSGSLKAKKIKNSSCNNSRRRKIKCTGKPLSLSGTCVRLEKRDWVRRHFRSNVSCFYCCFCFCFCSASASFFSLSNSQSASYDQQQARSASSVLLHIDLNLPSALRWIAPQLLVCVSAWRAAGRLGFFAAPLPSSHSAAQTWLLHSTFLLPLEAQPLQFVQDFRPPRLSPLSVITYPPRPLFFTPPSAAAADRPTTRVVILCPSPRS